MMRNRLHIWRRNAVTQQGIRHPLARDKSDTLLLLFACLLVLAPHTGHLPWWITLIGSLLLLWRGWLTVRGKRLPSHWAMLPVAALSMLAVYSHYRTLFGRDAGVAMLVLLLTFKLLEMRVRRDSFVVLFLCFFLLLTNFFYSQTILTALLMLLAVIVILTAQISFQYTGVVPSLRRRLRSGMVIFAMAAPLALTLFVLFPRIQGPLWGLPSDAHSGHTGLSNRMTPGAISNLAQSDEIAFRVRFSDPPPAKSRLYWRGPVLGQYDGQTWTELQPQLGTSQPLLLRLHGAPVRYQVTLEPHGQRWLFALETPALVPQIDGNPAHIDEQRQLLTTQAINQRLRYEATSYIDFQLEPTESVLQLQPWLQLPPGRNPRTLKFARQLRQQSGDDAHLVQTVLQYFRSEPFRYTLTPPLLGADGVDEFLFSTRAGFCEHYAGAFVVLMRALDIPARVVTGYQGGEINPVDGFMTVRQSDAHAWAEVWLDKRGWTRIDPTAAVAPNRIEINLAGALPPRLLDNFVGGLIKLDVGQHSWLAQWQKLRANWEAVTNAWNQWVLNYNADTQNNLLQALGFTAPDWHTLLLQMLPAIGIILAVTLAPQWWRRRRVDPADALYSALSRRLARHGMARQIHEGPRAYAQRLRATASPLPASTKIAAKHFLKLYENLRYGVTQPGATDTVNSSSHPPDARRGAVLSRLKILLNQCR